MWRPDANCGGWLAVGEWVIFLCMVAQALIIAGLVVYALTN
jgi:hypothetical protein